MGTQHLVSTGPFLTCLQGEALENSPSSWGTHGQGGGQFLIRGSLIIHRAAIAWMLAHGRQGHQHAKTGHILPQHYSQKRQPVGSLVSPQLAGLESHSQASPAEAHWTDLEPTSAWPCLLSLLGSHLTGETFFSQSSCLEGMVGEKLVSHFEENFKSKPPFVPQD